MRLLAALVALAAIPAIAAIEAEPLTGKVVSVTDGDTVRVLDAANVQLKVRLQGIDAPELGQPFGKASRERLAELVMRKDVVLHEHGKDKFGRTLGWLEVGGADVAAQMLADGLAWHYVKYDHSQTLAEAEQSARAAKRGLWADAKAMPPWDWRASEHKRKSAAVPSGR